MQTNNGNGQPTGHDESASVAEILERLLLDAGKPVDRVLIRRVVREACDAWPGSSAERWWRWLAEAGTNLDLKCKVVDCTPDSLVQLACDGASLVAYASEKREWLAVVGVRRRRFRLLSNKSPDAAVWCSAKELENRLADTTSGNIVRCVVLQNALSCNAASGEYGEAMSPFSRLIALLRPERSDLLILLVFSLVNGLLALATPIAVESLVNTVAFGRFLQPVMILAMMLFAFLGFASAINALQVYVVEIIQCRLFARVVADLAYRLPHLQTNTLNGEYAPELVNRFFDIVTVQKVCSKLLLEGLSLVLSTIVGMAVLAFYHPWLLGFDVALLLMLAVTIFVLGRGAVAAAIKESKCKYNAEAWLEDLARCPITFKYDGGSEFALERADQLTYAYLAARRKHFRVLMRQILFALFTYAIASTALLGLGGMLVIAGELTLGQLVAAELIVSMIMGSFTKLGKFLESFYDVMASVDKLGTLFDLPIERQEGMLHGPDDRPLEVRIQHVEYAFPDKLPVFSDFDLTIAARQRLAITGGSGSGKSVLLDLMYGTRQPVHGHLTFNGIDPRDLRPDVFRHRVVLVRGVEVFRGTVAENVHLARPEISASAVREALFEVGLLDDILRLPEGIDTPLLGRGAPLTQKQLRRLMLARAIVGSPGLLLIDGVLDAFSDDAGVELMATLASDERPWTLVVSTGRLAIAEQCDTVLRLGTAEEGEQHGTDRIRSGAE